MKITQELEVRKVEATNTRKSLELVEESQRKQLSSIERGPFDTVFSSPNLYEDSDKRYNSKLYNKAFNLGSLFFRSYCSLPESFDIWVEM